MMKRIILGCFLLGLMPILSTEVQAQRYTTYSKSCGSCGGKVSNNAKVGMKCPHCGVRWGYENERTTTTNSYGMTSNKVNLRSSPSTRASIITQIPAYHTVDIISRAGAWYYVSTQVLDGYNFRTYKGYVHSSLIK